MRTSIRISNLRSAMPLSVLAGYPLALGHELSDGLDQLPPVAEMDQVFILGVALADRADGEAGCVPVGLDIYAALAGLHAVGEAFPAGALQEPGLEEVPSDRRVRSWRPGRWPGGRGP